MIKLFITKIIILVESFHFHSFFSCDGVSMLVAGQGLIDRQTIVGLPNAHLAFISLPGISGERHEHIYMYIYDWHEFNTYHPAQFHLWIKLLTCFYM